MTTLLTKAFEKAAILPESLQDELACELITEIDWEQKWDKSLSATASKIDILADQAINEFKKGKTIEMEMDEL